MTNQTETSNLFYHKHVFFCINDRPSGHPRGSCKKRGSEKLRAYMKAKAKDMGLENIRINNSGCLDRCELGPTMVIYPEGVWYRCESFDQVDRILIEHLQKGKRVSDLMLGPEEK